MSRNTLPNNQKYILSIVAGLICSLLMCIAGCGVGESKYLQSSKNKALIGKWGKGNTLYVEFIDGNVATLLSHEAKYRWLEDGKHLRFEFGTGAAQIFEASLEGDVLIFQGERLKKIK